METRIQPLTRQVTAVQLLTMLLFVSLASSYKSGVRQEKKICNFKTDHGKGLSHNKDFEVKLWKDGAEASCYEIGEFHTVRILIDPSEKYAIKGFLIGLPKRSMTKYRLPSGVTPVEDFCGGNRLFSHKWLLYVQTMDFEFKLVGDSVTFNTTVVFSYSEFVENKHTTFTACSKPTPTPVTTTSTTTSTLATSTPVTTTSTTTSTLATPSSIPIQPTITPTPLPSSISCPLCEDMIADIQCPKDKQRYTTVLLNYTTNGGDTYDICTSKLLLHFVFPENCTVDKTCRTNANRSCKLEQFSVSNCSMLLVERKRMHTCKTADKPHEESSVKIKIAVERYGNYNCRATLSEKAGLH